MRLWLDYVFQGLFGLEERLSETTADNYCDAIQAKLAAPNFLPRALFERFHIEVLATTNSLLGPLADHRTLKESGWNGRIIPTFRPDPVVDPDFDGFRENLRKLGELTAENVSSWSEYLAALRATRDRFRGLGALQPITGTRHPQRRIYPRKKLQICFNTF